MARPQPSEYPEHFANYISQVPEDNLLLAWDNQLSIILNFLKSIKEDQSRFAYDDGKWSIKMVLQHMIDTERIMSYRALCIARKEKVSLPSFDENSYADHSNGDARQWSELTTEFINLRKSTTDLFRSFTPEMLSISGMASGKNITVESLGFVILGHVYHHKKVIEERYLQAVHG